jgi:predicted RND superfamily exporter protein
MNKGKIKDAQKELKTILEDAANFYEYRYEGIPLVHEVMKNLASCKTKLNQFSEALSLLDSTKDWQKVCEGSRSPSLILTENLIKNVHESRGDKKQKQESENELKKIQQSIEHSDFIYLQRTMVIPTNLDQS